MIPINYEKVYKSDRIEEWKVKEYTISRNNNKWLCTCSIKYKRDSKIVCKHIKLVQIMFKDY